MQASSIAALSGEGHDDNGDHSAIRSHGDFTSV